MRKEIKNQKGVATLVTAVVLMLAVFGITYYLSETVLEETRFVAADIRGKEAFQAAQAGIDYAKSLDLTATAGCVSNPNALPIFEVCVTLESAGLYSLVSEGFSNDRAFSRRVTLYMASQPGDIAPPEVPIVSKGTAQFSGSVTAINNAANLTVWTGLATDLNGAVDTYISIDGKPDQLSTTDDTYGPDVVLGDLNLANALTNEVIQSFYNKQDIPTLGAPMPDGYTEPCLPPCTDASDRRVYFGGDASRTQISALRTSYNVASNSDSFDSWAANTDTAGATDLLKLQSNFDIDFGTGKTFDIDSTQNFIGTPDAPVIIVVNGTVDLPANTVIFGTVVAENIIMNGNTVVFGGMVAINDTTAFDTAGTNFVKMDEVVLGMVTLGGEGIGPVKSSWKDW